MSEQRIFVSHASADAETAERIVTYLEAQGVPCWISSRDIPPKSIYAEEITTAMRSAQSCVVIVSKASNGSKAVIRELELASHYDKPFIPIRTDAVELAPSMEFYLRATQWVDYDRERDRALDRIASAYAARAHDSPSRVPPPASRPPAPQAHDRKRAPVAVLALAAIAAVAFVGLLSAPNWRRENPTVAPSIEAAVPATTQAATRSAAEPVRAETTEEPPRETTAAAPDPARRRRAILPGFGPGDWLDGTWELAEGAQCGSFPWRFVREGERIIWYMSNGRYDELAFDQQRPDRWISTRVDNRWQILHVGTQIVSGARAEVSAGGNTICTIRKST